jgi:hypothetical protein
VLRQIYETVISSYETPVSYTSDGALSSTGMELDTKRDKGARKLSVRNCISVCLTFVFNAVSSWIAGGMRNPSAMSRGEFGATVGLPRVLNLLKEHDIPATFCVTGHTADAYPMLVECICG